MRTTVTRTSGRSCAGSRTRTGTSPRPGRTETTCLTGSSKSNEHGLGSQGVGSLRLRVQGLRLRRAATTYLTGFGALEKQGLLLTMRHTATTCLTFCLGYQDVARLSSGLGVRMQGLMLRLRGPEMQGLQLVVQQQPEHRASCRRCARCRRMSRQPGAAVPSASRICGAVRARAGRHASMPSTMRASVSGCAGAPSALSASWTWMRPHRHAACGTACGTSSAWQPAS
mmetsp:Transcript_48427/g.144651  ORF Transcript_48427/g.144651 Transcript_48427/m.144651 type:complete len:227 (-) Transcript_48427:426-1106(-)